VNKKKGSGNKLPKIIEKICSHGFKATERLPWFLDSRMVSSYYPKTNAMGSHGVKNLLSQNEPGMERSIERRNYYHEFGTTLDRGSVYPGLHKLLREERAMTVDHKKTDE
jgi:hypothetical protein